MVVGVGGYEAAPDAVICQAPAHAVIFRGEFDLGEGTTATCVARVEVSVESDFSASADVEEDKTEYSEDCGSYWGLSMCG